MKIAYLLGSLNRGGTETLLLDVFRNASKNGLSAIGIYRKTGVYVNEFLQSGISLHYIPTKKIIFKYLLKLRSLFIDNKITIIHAQQSIDAIYGYFATMNLDIKVILTLHGYDFNESLFGKMILQYIIRKTDINIFVSHTQMDYYIRKYKLNPEKQKVIYNGISFDKLDNALIQQKAKTHLLNNKESLRSELHISNETILIGTVGNFNAVRDQYTICRFLKLLYDNHVDFHFIFVGKRIENLSQLYDSCVDFCNSNGLKDYVSFLGVRNDVPLILKSLDAFIYSTDHDTFGIAVVEALASAIPVFVNDWLVMNEITEQGKLATLYKTKDENNLLQEFMLFLQDKTSFSEKANSAAILVSEKYSIEKHIQHLLSVYDTL
ncbi:MAG: glycosyltransferase [Paludibacter sp.]